MSNYNETTDYRNTLLKELYSGNIPQRVPETVSVIGSAALQLAGYDLRYDQYGVSKLVDSADKLNARYDSDELLGGMLGNLTTPHTDIFSGSNMFIMGADGMIQHPEHQYMMEDELLEFAQDPPAFIWDKVVPRLYKNFNKEYPQNLIALVKTIKSTENYTKRLFSATRELAAKYNKATLKVVIANSRSPFDYYADMMRSFTGSMIDIRRQPQNVLEVVESIAPYMVFNGLYSEKGAPSRMRRVGFMCHMATYMRKKDFEKFWWPSFKEVIWDIYNRGFHSYIFCEEDWTGLLDYLDELPPLCEIMFEKGDLKTIKEKVGQKHIIRGYFPTQLLKYGTAEDVEAKAKEVLDTMAPGGKFHFGLDNSIITQNDVNWDNFEIMLDTVHEYGKY